MRDQGRYSTVRAGELLYVFGLAAEGARLDAALRDEARLAFVTAGGAGALVEQVSASDFIGQGAEARLARPEWLVPRLVHHEAVLRWAMERWTILPAGFGTLFSSADALRGWLRENREALAIALRLVEGCAEWRVTGSVDFARAVAVAKQRIEEEAGWLQGPLHFLQDSLGEKVRARARRLIAETAKALLLEVSAGVAGSRTLAPRPLPGDGGEEPVFHVALLLEAATARGLAARVDGLADEVGAVGLRVELSGPWPPYSFCPPMTEGPGR